MSRVNLQQQSTSGKSSASSRVTHTFLCKQYSCTAHTLTCLGPPCLRHPRVTVEYTQRARTDRRMRHGASLGLTLLGPHHLPVGDSLPSTDKRAAYARAEVHYCEAACDCLLKLLWLGPHWLPTQTGRRRMDGRARGVRAGSAACKAADLQRLCAGLLHVLDGLTPPGM
jgi:hypothetical protein